VVTSAAVVSIVALLRFSSFLIFFFSYSSYGSVAATRGIGFAQFYLVAVLYPFTESLRIIAIWISSVLLRGAHGIFDQLNWKMELSGKEERFRLEDAKWGGLPDGHVVGKPVPLFPRIER
jgi:hypothetical protein